MDKIKQAFAKHWTAIFSNPQTLWPMTISLAAHIIIALLIVNASVLTVGGKYEPPKYSMVTVGTVPEDEIEPNRAYFDERGNDASEGDAAESKPEGMKDSALTDFDIPSASTTKKEDYEAGVPIVDKPELTTGDRQKYVFKDPFPSDNPDKDNIPNAQRFKIAGKGGDGLSRDPVVMPKFDNVLDPKSPSDKDWRESVKPVVDPDIKAKKDFAESVTPDFTKEVKEYMPPDLPELENPQIKTVSEKPIDSLAPELEATFKTFYEEGNPRGWFELTISLKKESKLKSIPKNVLVIVDVSLSIPDEEIMNAKGAVNAYLKQLNPNDKFNVMIFSDETRHLYPDFVKADDTTIPAASAFIGRVRRMIKTDIHQVIKEASKILDKNNALYQVFLVSDGSANEGISDVRRILNDFSSIYLLNSSLFTFNAGEEKSNIYLLDLMAYRARGYFRNVPDVKEQLPEMRKFMAKYNNPVVAEIQANYGNMRVSETYPASLPNLYRESPVVIYGRCEHGKKVSLRLEGKLDTGEHKEFVLVQDLPDPDSKNEYIVKAWARGKIHYLIARLCNPRAVDTANRQDMINEIKRLGERYKISNPYSIPGVENEEKD